MLSERTSQRFVDISEWPERNIDLNPLMPAVK